MNPLRKAGYLKLLKKKKPFLELKKQYNHLKQELYAKKISFDWNMFSSDKLNSYLSFYLDLKRKKEEELIPKAAHLNKEIVELSNALKRCNENQEEIEKKYIAKINEKNQLILKNYQILNTDTNYQNLSKIINKIIEVLEERKKDYGRK